MLRIGEQREEHGFDEPLGLLSDCHRRIERFLEILVRVASEFGGQTLSPEAVEAVQRARKYFTEAAPKHTADEEVSLFPRMQAAADERGERCEAIDRLESDHQTATSLHAAADELLGEWVDGGSLAPARGAELREILGRLRDLYAEHIREEDEQLFPLAAKLLSEGQLADVGREMRERRGIAPSAGP